MSQLATSQSLTAQSLLDRFDVSAEDLLLLKECGSVLSDKIDGVVDKFYEWLGQQPEFNVFFSSKDTVERVKKLQKVYWADFFSGVVDQRYVDYRVHIGEIHAQRDMPNLIYFAAMLRFQLLFIEELVASSLAPEQRRPAVRTAVLSHDRLGVGPEHDQVDVQEAPGDHPVPGDVLAARHRKPQPLDQRSLRHVHRLVLHPRPA